MTRPELRFGTRGSELALWQTGAVIDLLRRAHPSVTCSVVTFTTRGDVAQHVPLTSFEGQGVFTDELEAALLAGEIDVAVHSLKDLPTRGTPGLTLGAFPCRADRRDVLVSREKVPLAALPAGAVVGTCSVRRSAQLLALRPDLTVRPIRGTVEARVHKVMAREFDATILAAAGLERLGLLHHVSEYFDPDMFLPAPGQGVLAAQCRVDDARTLSLLATIDDLGVRAAAEFERAHFHALERKRVVVTRPGTQALAFGAALARYGATPIVCPAIRINPITEYAALDAAVRRLHQGHPERYDWVVFTSVNGVTHFWARLYTLGGDRSTLDGVRVAAVGPATAAALAELGVRAHLIPVQYVAEQLAAALGDVRGQKFLLPRSAIARDALAALLSESGASVDDVPVYDTTPAAPTEAALRELRGGVDVVTFASASAVRGLAHMLGGSGRVPERDAVARACVACIGPVTAAAARDAGLRVDVVADAYTTDGLVQALVRHFAPAEGVAA